MWDESSWYTSSSLLRVGGSTSKTTPTWLIRYNYNHKWMISCVWELTQGEPLKVAPGPTRHTREHCLVSVCLREDSLTSTRWEWRRSLSVVSWPWTLLPPTTSHTPHTVERRGQDTCWSSLLVENCWRERLRETRPLSSAERSYWS